MTKYKVGDVLTLKVPVVQGNKGPIIKIGNHTIVVPGHMSYIDGGIDRALIVEHTPAPWVPAVGDRIKYKGSREPSIWAISYIDPDGDWMVKHVKSEYKSVVQTKDQYQFELDNS